MSSFIHLINLVVFCCNFFNYINYAQAQDVSNMLLEKYELCPETLRTDIILYVNPKDYNRGHQLIDVNFSSPYPVGNNVLMKITFEMESTLSKSGWITVFGFEDNKGFCHSLTAYLGEVAYGVERKMGLIPKACPIPAGAYHARNHMVDYNTLRLQTIPFGRVRAIVEMLHKQLNKVVSCHMFTLSNIKREE